MTKASTTLGKYKIVILSIVCLAVAVAWPGWRHELQAETYYGYDTDTGYETDTDYDTDDHTCIPCGPDEPFMPIPEEFVEIDINPCNDDNSIIIAEGQVMVAVKGSDVFDVHTIDTGSVRFAEAAPVKWFLKHITCDEDDEDFKKDMVFIFDRCDLGDEWIDIYPMEASLTGMTLSGVPFSGYDTVEFIHCGDAYNDTTDDEPDDNGDEPVDNGDEPVDNGDEPTSNQTDDG